MNSFINLIHLKFFCDAVTHQSITESAKLNYVTQSTVSQAITKIEQILSVKIVTHSRQKFEITEEGKILFEQAGHIFKAMQDIHEKIHLSKDVVQGPVKFACTNSLGMSFIASTYKQVQTTYPLMQPSIKLGNLQNIRQALKQNEVEFAIVVYDHQFEQFIKYPLKRGCFHLYQHIHAPLHLIKNGILIDSMEGMHVSALRQYFEMQGHSINIQSELAGWEVVARFTDKNIGMGFFPDYIVSDGRYPNLQISPYQLPLFEYEICAIYPKGNKLSRAACAFLDLFSLNSESS